MSRTEFFECECTSLDHTVVFSLDVFDPGDVELTVFYMLNHYRSWPARLWAALKYLFGRPAKHGHWDSTMLRPGDVERLQGLLLRYQEFRRAK